MKNARHKDDERPIDADCGCRACHYYSRAYVHHLVRSDEILGPMLMSQHNIQFYQDLMADMRDAISEGRMDAFAKDFLEAYASGDIDVME